MTWGGEGSWVDCAALTPAGCDRRTARHQLFFANLHTCPERKRGGEQTQHIRKGLRDASMAADTKKGEETGTLLG